MGSTSSKSERVSEKKQQDQSPKSPVANVNKHDGHTEPITHQEDSVDPENSREARVIQDNYNTTKFGAGSPLKPIEPGKKPKNFKEKKSKIEKTEAKKEKHEKGLSQSTRSSVTALKFEDDSDFENDIDEVLKIPVAVESSSTKSRDKENKRRNNKEKHDSDQFQDENYNNFNSYGHGRSLSRDMEKEDLPETYAQRLRRQQYTLQREMLLREKTIMRDPQEWQEDENDEMEIDSPHTHNGFDASKFRLANKGDDTKVKKDVFSTVPDDLHTPRYLQTTGQNFDEFDVQKQHISSQRELPQYDQSELDLMQQLEQDIL